MTENTILENLFFNNPVEVFKPNIDHNCFLYPKFIEITIKNKQLLIENSNEIIEDIRKSKLTVKLNNYEITSTPLDFFMEFNEYKIDDDKIIIPLNFEMFFPNVAFNFYYNSVVFSLNLNNFKNYSINMSIKLVKTNISQSNYLYQYILTHNFNNSANNLNITETVNINNLVKGFFLKCDVKSLIRFKLILNNQDRFDFDEILLNTVCTKINDNLLYIPIDVNAEINDCNKDIYRNSLYAGRIDTIKFSLNFSESQNSVVLYTLSANIIKLESNILKLMRSI